ncbi:MAG: dihydrofolate reductase [Bacteroidota bacterium]
MILASIVAHDPHLVIGKDGTLPWHYSEDLKFFKRTTMGHPIVMGRGVFEELDEKPLPGRRNVVLSRTRTYDQVETYSSWKAAREALSGEEKVFIIGGGEIYRQTMDEIDLLYVTLVHQEYEGDTFFPEYRDDISSVWTEIDREERDKLTFLTYQRKA